jgi:hypothetical protein
MKRLSVSEVLARANAAMVADNLDVTGALASLLVGTIETLPADAAAVLVECDGHLEVLAATSHQAAELEAHQAQAVEGPCLDAIRSGHVGEACGEDVLIGRWPTTGPAILRAGYRCVTAIPLSWQGNTFGALNVFRIEPTGFQGELSDCRALGDALTLVLVAGHLSADHVIDGLRAALQERAIVEQAKGVLSETHSLAMPDAFDTLLQIAESEGVTLGVAARRVIQRAQSRGLDG